MKKNKQKYKIHQTINFKIFVPSFVILILESAVILLLLIFEIGANTLNVSLINSFESSVNIRKNYMESSMSNKWTNISNFYDSFVSTTETYLKDNDLSIDELLSSKKETNALLLQQTSIFPEMIEKNHVNDAFLVLDTSYSDDKDMIYLRNKNPLKSGNSEIEVIYSPYSVFNSYYEDGFGLATDVDTNKYINIKDKDFFETPFYYSTYHENSIGYWACTLNVSSNRVLTYSLPIRLNNKTIGVIGIGLTEQYLRNYISSISKGDSLNIALIRAKDDKKISAFQAFVDYSLPDLANTNLTETSYSDVYTFTNDGENIFYFEEEINVYNGESPFEDNWYVVGVSPVNAVLATSNKFSMQVNIVVGVTFVVSVIAFVFTSELLSRPIRRVSKAMNNENVNKIPHTNIYEVDTLLDEIQESFENNVELNDKVARIIEDSSSKMAFFEYSAKEDEITTTPTFYKILGLDYSNGKISGNSFVYRLRKRERAIQSMTYETIDKRVLSESGTISFLIGNRYIKLKINLTSNGSFATLIDSTEEYLVKKEIEKERDNDMLTGLLNRRGFMNAIEDVFDNSKNGSLFMIDVDNLKLINDRYGHEFGDKYLKTIGAYFNKISANYHNLLTAHISGDEFIFYLYDYASQNEERKLIEELRGVAKESISYKGKEILISFSCGVCHHEGNINFEETRNRADYAMYEAKRSGKNQIFIFNDEEYEKYKKENILGDELNNIISNNLIDYAYQPIVDIHNGEVLGYEALMRPTIQGMSPLKVIEAAKKYNRLYDIEYMTMFNSTKRYIESGTDKRLFINSISSQLLSDVAWEDFLKNNKDILDKLVIEIIEEDFGQNDIMKRKATILENNKISYAIDDYGTGFNSIAMILDFAPKYIKIEGSLIRGIDKDEKKKQLTKTIVSYCKVNGIKVVAEAVETKEELKYVKEIGCDYVQGYLVAKPKFVIEDLSEETKELIRKC